MAMEEASRDDVAPPSLVSLSSFSPCPRRLSASFAEPSRPVVSSARRLAWVSLQGRLVNAEEASSARAIGGGLTPEETVAWQLFSPIERVLIVAVIGAATAESKKNRLIGQLKRSVELRDEVLSSMQQKVDSLCEQLNSHGELKGANALSIYGGDEMLHYYKVGLSNEAEQEERRMSDLSDWASSVTSTSEIQLNSLAIEQDIFNLKRACDEKDAIIKELTSSIQSSNVANSKRKSELEDIIRRKNTIITRLKKDMVILEQKVVHLTRLQRPSSSTSTSNCWQTPVMMDNLLFDMDSTTSPSSSDSDCSPKNPPQFPVLKVEEVSSQDGAIALTREQKSAPAKVSVSSLRQPEWHSKSRPATPLKEISINHKPNAPSAHRQVSASRDSKRIWRQTQSASKTSTPKKRWT